MNRAIAAAVALTICVVPLSAQADDKNKDKDKAGTVAVLPLVASAQDLEIYSSPVASAVVTSLKKKLGVRVDSVSLSGSIPDRVTLVIDGRIIRRGKDKVMLTATVRDPARGTREGTVSTRVRAITEIDSLAAELASLLAPVVEAASNRTPPDETIEPTHGNAKPVTDLSGEAGRPDPPDDSSQPAIHDRPLVVVVPPNGTVAGTVSVGPSSYGPMAAAINRLGFSAVRSSQSGIVGPSDASSEIAGASAEYALMIQVKKVAFTWRGVLSARGKVRVLLVDRQGQARYDRTLHTDTLVGSRGDRHAALVGFVTEQAIDIAYPALRRAMR